MTRGEGSGWHKESRRHHDAAMKGRPRTSSRKVASPNTMFQRDYMAKFLDYETRDLANLNKQYDQVKDDGDFDSVDLIDYILEGKARKKLAQQLSKLVASKHMTNAELVTYLKNLQKKLGDQGEKCWERREKMEETDYDEAKYEKVLAKEHECEWQTQILFGIIEDLENGKPYGDPPLTEVVR